MTFAHAGTRSVPTGRSRPREGESFPRGAKAPPNRYAPFWHGTGPPPRRGDAYLFGGTSPPHGAKAVPYGKTPVPNKKTAYPLGGAIFLLGAKVPLLGRAAGGLSWTVFKLGRASAPFHFSSRPGGAKALKRQLRG